MIVALDGPAGAGKSTVARLLAQRLGFQLVETGALYRAVGMLAREQGVSFDDVEGLEAIAAALRLRFAFIEDRNRVYLGETDITDALRAEQTASDASVVGAIPAVRAALLDVQRELAASQDSVMEGRDIGTVVCPGAEVKVFVTASPEVRAQRRVAELQARGEAADLPTVLGDILDRDERDSSREVAPLRPADDAVYLDTSGRSIEEVVRSLVQLVEDATPT